MITYPLNNIDYTAEDAELFHCTRTSGIWAEDSFSISVTGADNNVTIGKGIAWINNEEFSGKVSALKSAKTIDMGIADGVYPRIDVIAIQYSANNNATDVVVKKGTPATNPVRPAIVRSGAVYELYLASIYRPAASTVVTAMNVTDLRLDESVCGLMSDSVTKIDTGAINAQVLALIESLNAEIESVKNASGIMLAYTPNSINVDSTDGNWTVDISENGHGTIPALSVNVTQTSGAHFNVQTAIKCDTSLSTENRTQKMWFRDKYQSGEWSAWCEVLTEENENLWTKLWENPRPSSAFEEQDITFNDNGSYGLYLVKFRATTSVNRKISEIVSPGETSEVQWIENLYVTSGMKFNGRQFTVNVGNAHFGYSVEKEVSGQVESQVTGSNKLIPQVIYGIKIK